MSATSHLLSIVAAVQVCDATGALCFYCSLVHDN